MSAETDFWNWFDKEKNEFYYFENNQRVLFEQVTEKLKQFHKELTFQFSPVREDGKREFCISAGGIKEAFPAVIKLVKEAPVFSEWEITAFRQRVPGNDIQIEMGDLKLGYGDIYFRFMEDGDKLALQLNIKNFKQNDNRLLSAVFILLDALIGEYDMETRISSIDWEVLDPKALGELMPLVELRVLVDELKTGKHN